MHPCSATGERRGQRAASQPAPAERVRHTMVKTVRLACLFSFLLHEAAGQQALVFPFNQSTNTQKPSFGERSSGFRRAREDKKKKKRRRVHHGFGPRHACRTTTLPSQPVHRTGSPPIMRLIQFFPPIRSHTRPQHCFQNRPPSSSIMAVIVDAYTHYAPKALAQYLEECSGRPLVFAKVCDEIDGMDVHVSWGGPVLVVQIWMDKGSRGPLRPAPTYSLVNPPPKKHTQLFDRIPLLTDVAQRVAFLDARQVQTHVLVPLPWLETVPEVHRDKERYVCLRGVDGWMDGAA